MGLFKKDVIKEICVVKENMWNIFTSVPWRAADLRQGWRFKKWSKLDAPLVELVWMAHDEFYEEKYFQYAWLFKDGAEIEDGLSRILVEDGFIYNGVKCKHLVVPSQRFGFRCNALLLESPNDVINRLWRLYDAWLRKRKTDQLKQNR